MADLKKVYVTVRAEQDQLGSPIKKDGVFIIDKHFFVSHSPRMYGLVLHDKEELLSFIQKSGIFVVNFVDEDKDGSFELIEADKIFCNKIEHAEHLECEVVHKVAAGDSWV